MGIGKRRSHRSGRAPLPSPGRPPVAGRSELRRFWLGIAQGLTSEDAALAAGMSQPVGTRLFRQAGGVAPAMFRSSTKPPSERYLAFAEREEIALLRVQGLSRREIGRRLGRSASTISRELRRNAATRSGGLEYRASTAQWHADRSAQTDQACAQHNLAHLCGAATGRRRHDPKWRRRSWSGRSVEGPPARSAKGSAMGQGLEPGADRPTLADRLPGRQDDAHQPRSHLSSPLRSGSGSATPRTVGLLANGARAAGPQGPRPQSR